MKLYRTIRICCEALFFPQTCVIFGSWVVRSDFSPLCGDCFLSLEPSPRRICYYCGVSLPGNLLELHATCSRCRSESVVFDFARCYGAYAGNLRSTILKFKFEGHQRLAYPLASLLETCYQNSALPAIPDWIVPIPLHPRKRRERRFDQTLLMSRILSRRLGIPVCEGLCRIRATVPQSGLDLPQRRGNVRGAFGLSRTDRLWDRNILLIDDVMTTGTTVSEASRLLRKEAQVRTIVVLTVARVLLDTN